MGNKRSWEAYLESFVRAKLPTLKARKKARLHVGNKRSWEVYDWEEGVLWKVLRWKVSFPMKESFAGAKPLILRPRKKARLHVGNKRSVGGYLGRLCGGRVAHVGRCPWVGSLGSFAGVKLPIFKDAKKARLTWKTSEAGRLTWEKCVVVGLPKLKGTYQRKLCWGKALDFKRAKKARRERNIGRLSLVGFASGKFAYVR